ncbi:8-oxo-dGTP diphosphatase [Marinilactibacillus sp. XAAS-LB27]|uniref:8-oxo-dGTP diphosphatase n=1 Tax=Marinilactibacillus sp. XAAS-LB27 TaxID=3114538 RepID=UPI002E171D84|nr:8-oxo-dGTP diphosphatase [Marinilactibacillus sp. XAAS-LB27]
MEKTILTNMVMIEDGKGNVVVQDRIKTWKGLAFPGGKVEKGESFVESAIREVKEETGLEVSSLQLCGVKQFQTELDERYIVFLYKTDVYKGTLVSSDEGEVKWIPLNQLKKADTVEDFDQLLEVFQKHSVSELYYEQNQVNVL